MARRHNKKGRAINGILLLDKPIGISSNRALQNTKHLFQAQKAGHTGSLDPLATGMLPICFGEATKFSAFLLDADKTYLTKATLGITTSTGDAEGEIIGEQTIPALNREIIESVLETFCGEITQIPPMYSALKHQGKPLYELARKGIEIERKSRNVVIYKLVLLAYTDTTIDLKVECSKGTYIRTLVEDIGHKLGCGAHVSMLRRSNVLPFKEHKMLSMESLATTPIEELDNTLLPVDSGLQQFPMVILDGAQSEALQHGKRVEMALPNADYIRVYNQHNEFLGIGTPENSQLLKPKRLIQQA